MNGMAATTLLRRDGLVEERDDRGGEDRRAEHRVVGLAGHDRQAGLRAAGAVPAAAGVAPVAAGIMPVVAGVVSVAPGSAPVVAGAVPAGSVPVAWAPGFAPVALAVVPAAPADDDDDAPAPALAFPGAPPCALFAPTTLV